MLRIQNKKTGVEYRLVDASQQDRRIDNYLAGQFRDLPKKRIYQMLRKGEVRVNGRRIKQDYRLREGDEVRIPPLLLAPDKPVAEPPAYLSRLLEDCVLYEDDYLLAINKPSGIVVHGGSGRDFGVIELLRRLRRDGDRLQLVHRLDRETSGVLLLTRDMGYLRLLQQAFREGRVGKHYTALLAGRLERKIIRVDRPLERNRVRSGERLSGISADGKQAHSCFKLQRLVGGMSLVDVEIGTGRTHQIRVHAQSIGHPVAGDAKYGDKAFNKEMKKQGLKSLFLHAARVDIPRLAEHGALTITAPLPGALAEFVKRHAG